jgi:hypothetical protein
MFASRLKAGILLRLRGVSLVPKADTRDAGDATSSRAFLSAAVEEWKC